MIFTPKNDSNCDDQKRNHGSPKNFFTHFYIHSFRTAQGTKRYEKRWLIADFFYNSFHRDIQYTTNHEEVSGLSEHRMTVFLYV